MTKHLLILFLCLLTAKSWSQNKFVEIRGKVYSHPYYDDKDTVLIKNVDVILIITDSATLRLTTDESGRYHFTINKTNRKARLYIETNRKTGNNFKDMCGFLASKEQLSFDLMTSSLIIKDFCATPVAMCSCMPMFPTFIYHQNSIPPKKAITRINLTVDSAIKILFQILSDFPYIAISIDGHSCSNEKDVQKLSEDRANYIANTLISLGVDKKRLKLKGHGSSLPLNNLNEFMGYEKLVFKKGELNKRVSFGVVSFNYWKEK